MVGKGLVWENEVNSGSGLSMDLIIKFSKKFAFMQLIFISVLPMADLKKYVVQCFHFRDEEIEVWGI